MAITPLKIQEPVSRRSQLVEKQQQTKAQEKPQMKLHEETHGVMVGELSFSSMVEIVDLLNSAKEVQERIEILKEVVKSLKEIKASKRSGEFVRDLMSCIKCDDGATESQTVNGVIHIGSQNGQGIQELTTMNSDGLPEKVICIGKFKRGRLVEGRKIFSDSSLETGVFRKGKLFEGERRVASGYENKDVRTEA